MSERGAFGTLRQVAVPASETAGGRWVRVHDGPSGRGRDRAPRVWCGGESYGVGTMARPPESWRRNGGSGSAEEDAQSVAEIFVAQVTTPPNMVSATGH